ncbi:unnamed protein product [Dibothriocephalus latus]|uniref:Protein OS9-like domain-containing protein n=1 Tax=Dibothriocephalus latus TaxID=60516 RepID=A0A3P6PK21_DIBLA|nr:unnamed protein product [Dibothriocephalus latus]
MFIVIVGWTEGPPPPPPPPPKPVDYGPEQGFLMLTESNVGCLELEDKEYVYSLCPFKDAHQRSRSGGSSSLLGNWKGWVDHPEGSETWDREAKMKLPYKEMLYENGHSCWNGPNRSVKVSCFSLSTPQSKGLHPVAVWCFSFFFSLFHHYCRRNTC